MKPLTAPKRVPITVILHIYEDIYSDDEGLTRFYIEEIHCLDNYIKVLAEEAKKNPNTCTTCYRGKAYVGHLPFSEIAKLPRPMPEED